MRQIYRVPALLFLLGFLGFLASSAHAAAPKITEALKLKPIQRGVSYDRPTADEAKNCKISTENAKGRNGWIVRDAQGQTLRRFADTNKDKVVDRWSYYQAGVEVYRDIDSNFDGKVDQYRWLNTAGRRWAYDKNQDGKIDLWRAISAEEVSAEIVAALASGDSRRFGSLLLSGAELKSLGLSKEKQSQLAKTINSAQGKFPVLAKRSKAVTPKSRWVDFSATQPGVVPAGDNGSTKDLVVYENVAAMIETDGKQGLVHIGTMIRVGDAWRVIDVPRLSDQTNGQIAGNGTFFNDSASSSSPLPRTANSSVVSNTVQKQLAELDKLAQQVASAAPKKRAGLNQQRAKILESLFNAAQTQDERKTWAHQLADMLSTEAQSGGLPDGIDRLNAFAKKLNKKHAYKDLAAYSRYRALMAGYSNSMQAEKPKFAKIQEKWLTDLAQFVKEYPRSPDTPEAMLQLAIAEEFAGEEEKAKKWYSRIATEFSSASVAKKAKGAKTRLDSVGKVISLKGKDFHGRDISLKNFRKRYVVVQYWATWCEPCKADMEDLTDLVGKYGKKGFSVLGVNLDSEQSVAASYLKKNRHPWINLYEAGGLESRLANELGILTLPTMILLDQDGKVINRNIHVGELESELKKRLK